MRHTVKAMAAAFMAVISISTIPAAVSADAFSDEPAGGIYSYTDDFYGDVFYSADCGYYYINADGRAVLIVPDAALAAETPSYRIDGYYNTENTTVDDISVMKYTSDSGNALYIRTGDGCYDVSGDHTAYDIEEAANINGAAVTFKGFTGEGYHLAVWTKGGRSFSVKSRKALTFAELQNIVFAVI